MTLGNRTGVNFSQLSPVRVLSWSQARDGLSDNLSVDEWFDVIRKEYAVLMG